MRWTKVGLGTAKYFHENFLYLSSINFFYKISNDQERKKEGKNEVEKLSGGQKDIFW